MSVPTLFISYSHDSPEYKDRILALSDRLRQDGVDSIVDQYEQSPQEGWPMWCERQVERADFVLVACTETYWRRFRGEETPGTGLGGTWEGHIITQQLYNSQGRNTRFIPVAFSQEDLQFIPLPLQGGQAYELDRDYDPLYRRLTGQPLVTKPVIGELVTKPSRKALPPQPNLERKIWQVGRPRNAFFTGREKVLTDLRRELDRRGSAALGGLGGVGKTHTAIEYVYRNRQLYTAVFWVNAESRETLVADFVTMAAALSLPSAQAKDQEMAVADVKRWLEENAGWLLVLDNADELLTVQSFLPKQGQSHLLLTTRALVTSALAQRISVKDMDREEGALLLLRRSGAISRDASLEDASATDREIALQISDELGGLPLALDQAGAFIEETQRSLAEYARIYASEKASLLAERGSLGEHPSVAVTFSVAFEKLAAKSPEAADLIRVCAFLSPDAIPEEIFTAGASELGENLGAAASSELRFARTVGEAVRFSLLNRDAATRTLGIHRLVQIVVKDGMSKEDRRVWAERTVRAVDKAFPLVEFSKWALCQRLITHAQVCASLVAEWDFMFRDAARLLNQAAIYLLERALFSEAEPLFVRSIAIYDKTQGPDHSDVANCLNNLAELYRREGKYAQAEPLFQRSRVITEKALGPDHPSVATGLNNLAALYGDQGKYAQAEPLNRRSLTIYEKALGPDHPVVSSTLNNLANLYCKQKKYAESDSLHQRALAIREKALGPDHPDVAQSLNNLGVLYDNQKKYAEAEALYQRSLAIREKALGPDHPHTRSTRSHLEALRKKLSR